MSTAKELFKELGYEKAEKSESVVLYTNGYGDTISFKETKHVVITPIQGCRTIIMTCLLENAIHKQSEELGWLEKEERAETNYEHYKDVILEDSGLTLALVGGKPCKCIDVHCSDCEFSTGHGCGEKMKEWLDRTYEKTTYKLTHLEYDLISTYITYHSDRKFCDCRQLIELKDKGHFKNVDKDVLIKDILSNSEVVKDEKC